MWTLISDSYGGPGGRAMRRCLCANVDVTVDNVDVTVDDDDVHVTVDYDDVTIDDDDVTVDDDDFTRDGLKLHPATPARRPRPYSSTRGHVVRAC